MSINDVVGTKGLYSYSTVAIQKKRLKKRLNKNLSIWTAYAGGFMKCTLILNSNNKQITSEWWSLQLTITQKE